jgi:hypothetical protein
LAVLTAGQFDRCPPRRACNSRSSFRCKIRRTGCTRRGRDDPGRGSGNKKA